MPEESVQRRLAAILAADVVGYSRLMGVDDAGTRARFNAHLNELIEPTIASRRGRIVKTTGDALLVEFASVVDAVQCAVEIQEGMAERNADEPDDRRIVFRIGVNLGDVIIEGDDIHGDGVNVAARLEALANPGGVSVSGKVFEEVAGRLDFGYEDLGPQQVKNIAQPVPAYRVLPEGQQATATLRKKASSRWRVPAIAVAVLVIIAAGGLAWWQPWEPNVESASIDKMAHPLPDKPSIAVMPFTNMSGDEEQEYFSDGITEDIITDLAKVSGLFVIAWDTSSNYRGPVDVRKVARDFGVRHVLKGSVRRSGEQLRITVKLVDATTRNNIWAERYDRDLKDVFAVQAEVAQKVVSALAVTLSAGEKSRLGRGRTASLAAYDLFLQAKHLGAKPSDRDRLLNRRRIYERVIELDPAFAGGYAGLSKTYSFAIRFGHSRDHPADARKSMELARKAMELEDGSELSHVALANAHLAQRRPDTAIAVLRKALPLFPNSAEIHFGLGQIYGFAGSDERGVKLLRESIRLNPNDVRGAHRNMLGIAFFVLGRFREAVKAWEDNVARGGPVRSVPAFWAAAYHQLGRLEEAKAARERLLRTIPDFSTRRYAVLRPMKPAIRERAIELFLAAGLPE